MGRYDSDYGGQRMVPGAPPMKMGPATPVPGGRNVSELRGLRPANDKPASTTRWFKLRCWLKYGHHWDDGPFVTRCQICLKTIDE